MRISIQAETGLGSSAITAECEGVIYSMLEGPISSGGNSWYFAEIDPPAGGPYAVIIYLAGDVIGNDIAWGDEESAASAVTGNTTTVGQLLKAVYANLGAVDIEDEPTPAQLDQGLRALNAMLATWKRVTLYSAVTESFTLEAGKAVYTVGSGQDFDTAWPFQVFSAFTRDSNGIDIPVGLISQGEYNAVTLKSVSSRPRGIVYNPKGYPAGSVTFHHIPDQAYTFFWTVQKLVGGYSSIEDQIGIAPEYEEAIEYNLTVRLAPKVGAKVTPEIAALALSSKSILPMAVEPAAFDGAFDRGSRYDIRTDAL